MKCPAEIGDINVLTGVNTQFLDNIT